LGSSWISIYTSVGMKDLFDVALQVTDQVLGEGTYAQVNRGTHDPGARQAIRRWRAGGDEDAPMVDEEVESSDPRLDPLTERRGRGRSAFVTRVPDEGRLLADR
jgi:hypothetical protein